MQSNPSCPSALPDADAGIVGDDEAERVRRLVAQMTETKRMLSGLLSDLATLGATMAVPEPREPVPRPAARGG